MSSSTREIITIQSGHYANYVGAHWWNLQESSFCFDPNTSEDINCLNHDVLFREGKTLLGDFTFTPRLIAFDLRQSMGSLKSDGTLYDLPTTSIQTWFSEPVVEEAKKIDKNEFLKSLNNESDAELGDGDNTKSDDVTMETDHNKKSSLSDSINVWSDFLKTHFHPKTMCLIDNTTGMNAEEENYDSIAIGRAVVRGESITDDIERRVHFFTEECDHLQGFQLLIDPYDRFAGIGSRVLEMLSDDYDTKSRFSIGVTPSLFANESPIACMYRTLSSVVAYSSICEFSSLFLPLSCSSSIWQGTESTLLPIPHLNYNPMNYHTSAILASLLDTCTMPIRSKLYPMHLADISSSLNYDQRKIASMVATLPLPVSSQTPFLDYLMGLDTLPWLSFSSLNSHTVEPNVQQCVVRGINGSVLRKPQYPELPRSLGLCESSSDILNLYLKETFPQTRSNVLQFTPSLKIEEPFPQIFDRKISSNGTLSILDRSSEENVQKVPILTGLQSTSATGDNIRQLVARAKMYDLKRVTGFFDDSFEVDDYNDCIEKLLTMSDDYPSSQQHGDTDSDNDDA